MGGILETTLNLTQLADTIRKTVGSIGGLDISVKGILSDQAKLGSEFQNLSNKTGAFSADISVLTDRIFQLSKNTNYSIESMTSMQQTLITTIRSQCSNRMFNFRVRIRDHSKGSWLLII